VVEVRPLLRVETSENGRGGERRERVEFFFGACRLPPLSS